MTSERRPSPDLRAAVDWDAARGLGALLAPAGPVDERGVLVLSEFAGAADELSGALLVNPHDIDGLKDTIYRAITMEPRESRKRMRRLRRRVLGDDVAKWSNSFLSILSALPVPGGEND